jgi:hypothetical protein
MTEGITRRSVLRRGAVAAGGLAAGVAAGSGTAAATLDCPRPVRYWENHPAAFSDTRTHFRLDRTGEGYDRETAFSLLRESPDGDKAVRLARQVVAAQANVAAIRVGDGGACQEAAAAIKPRIGDAVTWLACSDGAQDDAWAYVASPDDDGLTWTWGDARGVDGEPILSDLRAFNRGRTCEHCGGGTESATGDGDAADEASTPVDETGPGSRFRPWRTFVENHVGRD